MIGMSPEIMKLIAAALAGAIIGVAATYVALKSGGKKKGKNQKNQKKKGDAAPSPTPGMVEIYVGNLSYDMTEAQFRKEFESYGVVKSARIIGHRNSGRSKGYGFVEMPHRKEAEIAIKALNGKDILGRPMRVNEARNGRPIE